MLQLCLAEYRFRNTALVLEEYPHQNKSVFFCDDNFTDNFRRTKIAARNVIARLNSKDGAYAEGGQNDELLILCAMSKIAYIGLESINPSPLKHIEESVEDIRESIRAFMMRYQVWYVCFGSDEDTVQTIQNSRLCPRNKD